MYPTQFSVIAYLSLARKFTQKKNEKFWRKFIAVENCFFFAISIWCGYWIYFVCHYIIHLSLYSWIKGQKPISNYKSTFLKTFIERLLSNRLRNLWTNQKHHKNVDSKSSNQALKDTFQQILFPYTFMVSSQKLFFDQLI